MSRGGWIMLIGGVALLVGIGLFAFGFAGLFAPDTTTLSPGAFQNRTVDVQSTQSALTYMIRIQDFTADDELTVFIRTPSGVGVQRSTITSPSALTAVYIATETGVHTVVMENTGAQSVTFIHAANEVDFTVSSPLAIGTFLGFAGFVIFIIGLILWIVDRVRARRQQPTGMPPPTSPP
jgi:hypothetical protein